MSRFVNLSGNEIVLPRQATSVGEAKALLAPALSLRYPEQVRLIADGELDPDQELPAGDIQVAIGGPPPEGTWARILWDAEHFDEELLRSALNEGYPSPLGVALPRDFRTESYWTERQSWAHYCSMRMQKITIATVGAWADYWDFAQKADTYGYWMVKPPYPDSQEKTVDQVIADVKHWRELLLDLSNTFDRIISRTQGMNDAEIMEIAAAELLQYSDCFQTKTSFKYGFETWYAEFQQVLVWFACHAGMTGVDQAIEYAIDGVFSSYSVKDEGALEFAKRMAKHFGVELQDFDATSQWRSIRGSLDLSSSVIDSASTEDLHFQYIWEVDQKRSQDRALGMTRALRAARGAALSGQPLSTSLLQSWMRDVLDLRQQRGGQLPLRKNCAYAKRGRERYPTSATLERDVQRCLDDAEDIEISPAARAARAYLDICFYHPFDDGNGRLARLVADFVLTKASLSFKEIGPLFSISRSARDAEGAQSFIRTMPQMVGRGAFNDVLQSWNDPRPEAQESPTRGASEREDYAWFDCFTQGDDLLEREKP